MFVINEYYHIYNRGAHKSPIFLDKIDYQRFLYLLYIANSNKPLHFYILKQSDAFLCERQDQYVDIVAYCLMPNHFHIAVKEIVEGGISRFVHKLCTAYVMYYNFKYDHSGTIFQGPYNAKHVDSDGYLLTFTQLPS
ncbi:MAG: hypothetical protein A3D50_00005 [Candidatus Taylorbacteria bacterium RIFCSPHIGHO2_02_FULL_44_12]|uniref:Transposase IS200-like domain-containing protein n=1 Tax=Candidatus Taylorbacteria bacterium RIFCSPHIGHO2_02_FULL_44_12 TaxID=1802308 RepID=A0A1G2MKJ4_9BACT|nr:MAG: hypothetical protein A3D50_00005 [Candidatus Taylorbacteria bacterium RIFCSPHIGHO2_02_FULL_44_12]